MRRRVHLSARSGPIVAAAVLAVSATLAGCSQFDVKPVWPWSTAKNEKPQAGRMTVAWTHATEVEGGREVRGFRGRIFFYPKEKPAADGKKADPEREQPMKVEGTLTVYAFDVTAEGKLTSVAPRKFFFEPEKFKKQCSDSNPGPSYQVWLPWDGVGGPPKKVNLWTRFDGINHGSVVMSDNSPQLLPGVSQTSAVAQVAERTKPATGQSPPAQTTSVQTPAQTTRGPIAQAGYEVPGESTEKSSPKSDPAGSGAPATADWWK